MRIMCEYCFAELSRDSLAKHHKTKECELFKTRNDNYIVVDGRTYLRVNRLLKVYGMTLTLRMIFMEFKLTCFEW